MSIAGIRGWIKTAPSGLADASAYLATDLPIGIAAFTVMVTGMALSVGLLITFILAVPCIWATVWAARWFASVERWRLWAFFDRDLPAPEPPQTSGWWSWIKVNSRSRTTWRQIAYSVIQLPVACLTFTVVAVAGAVPLGLIAMPVYINAIPSERMDFWVGAVTPGVGPWLLALVGLALVPVAVIMLRVAARARAMLSVALLSPGPADLLQQRVERLETTRSRVVDVVEAERRRIERDLHDGAQQRLIALALDIGMAREKLAEQPDEARSLLDDAHDEAKRAIVELRDLARGIHPAVLTDRGLPAALASVAGRSPVPVDLRVDLDERLPATIEGIAYFVVNEALVNVAKHAGAKRASVAVARQGQRLVIEVTDDGVGGADPAAGTGLAGLADRVAAVDGWLHVTSPTGGPTTLTVELPCAS